MCKLRTCLAVVNVYVTRVPRSGYLGKVPSQADVETEFLFELRDEHHPSKPRGVGVDRLIPMNATYLLK